ncbi:MAG: BCD family MFS transporter [Thiohalocapsa sp.]|jgi:BCD family chlorophyll transporter-like MFS transporter|uniref:BCD family MFS transporter n=1 Tax=Thiohalocapsa sp. TaxID=2497641 RepID=UPI0025EFE3C6|nr:BCD family MFS transporter [Thiohalocapsa sp.]MCG6941855.1 BCD family MFS transporter [Thiohalocapsa sp.]
MSGTSLEELKRAWVREVLPKILPFADAATKELPLPRLLRLSLFQASVGMMMVLLYGTMNRVMVVEKGVPTWLISLMVALPVLVAPFRALIGFKSDIHRSAFGWRRVPFIWFGTLMQFGGLAIMPFALILSVEGGQVPNLVGWIAAGLAFLIGGAGMHTTQTAGLALATDLATEESRPRVVALLFVMLQVSMLLAALAYGVLLTDFNSMSPGAANGRLIGVLQGVALVTIAFNMVALWKQEAINTERAERSVAEKETHAPQPRFIDTWRQFLSGGNAARLLVVLGLGTAGFAMQEILLEPYGGQVLSLTVSQTTRLTAIWAFGSLVAFGLTAHLLSKGAAPYRIALYGALIGIIAFVAVIAADPLGSPLIFRIGALLIGFGGGLFSVGTLTAAMDMARGGQSGLALGAWGAIQATCYGIAVGLGGALRDVFTALNPFADLSLGAEWSGPVVGYSVVYALEILLLIAALVVLLPLALRGRDADKGEPERREKFGIVEMP